MATNYTRRDALLLISSVPFILSGCRRGRTSPYISVTQQPEIKKPSLIKPSIIDRLVNRNQDIIAEDLADISNVLRNIEEELNGLKQSLKKSNAQQVYEQTFKVYPDQPFYLAKQEAKSKGIENLVSKDYDDYVLKLSKQIYREITGKEFSSIITIERKDEVKDSSGNSVGGLHDYNKHLILYKKSGLPFEFIVLMHEFSHVDVLHVENSISSFREAVILEEAASYSSAYIAANHLSKKEDYTRFSVLSKMDFYRQVFDLAGKYFSPIKDNDVHYHGAALFLAGLEAHKDAKKSFADFATVKDSRLANLGTHITSKLSVVQDYFDHTTFLDSEKKMAELAASPKAEVVDLTRQYAVNQLCNNYQTKLFIMAVNLRRKCIELGAKPFDY